STSDSPRMWRRSPVRVANEPDVGVERIVRSSAFAFAPIASRMFLARARRSSSREVSVAIHSTKTERRRCRSPRVGEEDIAVFGKVNLRCFGHLLDDVDARALRAKSERGE